MLPGSCQPHNKGLEATLTLQSDAGAAQLAVDVGVVGIKLARCASYGRAVQPGLQILVAQGLGQGPVHAGCARVAGDVVDRGLGDAECGANLAGAQCPAVQ